MMFITVIDVGGRYLFNKPLHGSYEMIGMLLVFAGPLGMALCQQEKNHISVSLVLDLLPERIRKIFTIIGLFLSLGIFSIISWKMFDLSIRFFSKGRGGVSADLGLNLGYIAVVFAIGALMFSLILLLHLVQSFFKLIQR